MRLYVVRHGQTDLNIAGRMQGRKGLDLNKTGEAQALALKDELKDVRFYAVYSSPQPRAVSTAEIITGGSIPIITDARLDVYDVGEADGVLIDENMKMKFGFVPAEYAGVEDIEQFVNRVYSFTKELAARYGGLSANIMIAGHKCTTGCIDAYFNGMPKDGNFFALSSKNGRYKVYEV